ncbi:hypothetical protein EB118_23340 [bacterium]|nr:hypothetical protein [bacterium]
MQAFNSNGFQVGGNDYTNSGSATYVGWQWKGGGTPAVTNNNGSITSTVSANTTAGFSIVTYTGTGANATVGHGLGVAPQMIIVKNRSSVVSWPVYHANLTSAAYAIYLNKTDAQGSFPTLWNSTAPTSTVFSLGTGGSESNGTGNFVAYCFSAVSGYSAFGSYTGNGSTDGPFVFVNFRPRFLMLKRTDAADNWYLYDTARDTFNVVDRHIHPNLSNAEGTGLAFLDILSNGFKLRQSYTALNASGGTYIYAAFAENPFKVALAR